MAKRFGISLLSKNRYSDAFNDEVMIDKLTGEVLMKTIYGDTISYNYNSRLNSHINDTRRDANNANIYGKMLNVTFDNKVCPFAASSNTNYITTPLIVNINCKRLMIHLDIDALTVNSTGHSIHRNNLNVELKIALQYSDNTTSTVKTITSSVHHLNQKVFALQNGVTITTDDTKTVTGFQITSFKILNTINDYELENTTIQSSQTIRAICNGMILVVET